MHSAPLATGNIVTVSILRLWDFLQLEPSPGLQATSEDLAFSKTAATLSLRNNVSHWPLGPPELPEKKLFRRGQNQVPVGSQRSSPRRGVAQTLAMNLNLSCKTEVFQDPGTQRCKKGQLNL